MHLVMTPTTKNNEVRFHVRPAILVMLYVMEFENLPLSTLAAQTISVAGMRQLLVAATIVHYNPSRDTSPSRRRAYREEEPVNTNPLRFPLLYNASASNRSTGKSLPYGQTESAKGVVGFA